MSRERNNNLEITENQQIEAEESDNEATRSEIQEQKETEMGRDKMRKDEKIHLNNLCYQQDLSQILLQD